MPKTKKLIAPKPTKKTTPKRTTTKTAKVVATTPKTTKKLAKKTITKTAKVTTKPKTAKKSVAKVASTAKPVAKKSTKSTPKAIKKTTRKSKSRTKSAAVLPTQVLESAPISQKSQLETTQEYHFASRNPLDYFLRLDVLIALSLFFLLVTTVISFTIMSQEINELQDAVRGLEAVTYGN